MKYLCQILTEGGLVSIQNKRDLRLNVSSFHENVKPISFSLTEVSRS